MLQDNLSPNVMSNVFPLRSKRPRPMLATTFLLLAAVAMAQDGTTPGSAPSNIVRLRIHSTINQFSDETVVTFNSGVPTYDTHDVPKFIFAHPAAPQIAAFSQEGVMLAINAHGPYTSNVSIPITVKVAVNGTYTISIDNFQNPGLSCLRLEDLATGTVTPLAAGASYGFAALTVDDINEPRFLLHASAPLQLVTAQATCNGHADGSASLAITNGPVDVTWTESDGDLLLAQTGVMPGTTALQALHAGVYHVRLEGGTTCGSLHTFFTITEPATLEVEATTMPSTCPDSEDGSIDIHVLGGQAPYTYQWSNEADTDHLEVAAGTYTVLITDANGCTFAPQAYVVGSGEGPDAGIGVAQTLVQVGEEVHFVPNTLVGVENTWHFGDGHTSNALEALHSYSAPGTYTVTLTVDNSECISTTTLEIQVELSTGIANTVGRNINAFVSGDHIVIDHDFSGPEPVVVRLYSTGGHLAQEHRLVNSVSRITLPANELSSGIWLARISSGASLRTFSLPIVH